LNAQLKSDPSNWNSFLNNNSLQLGYTPFIEEMTKGKTTESYTDDNLTIPSPRQLKFLIQSRQVDIAIQLIKKFADKDITNPIYHLTLIYSFTNYLLSIDTLKPSTLYKAYKNILGRSVVNKQFIYFGRIFSLLGENKTAKAAFEKLMIIDPENNQEVKELIQKYLKE
jgi:hypothetical protein